MAPEDAARLQITTQFNRASRLDSLQPEGERPVAQPVDTFVDNSGGNQLEQLAHSLSGVSPEVAKLSDFLSAKDQKQDEAQADSDVSTAVRSGASTYADAVKSGAIPASASPYYRMYAQKQFGQLMAGKMASDMEADGTQALMGSTSMSQVDQYMQKYQSTWLQAHGGDTGNLAFSEGFNPSANAEMARLRSRAADAIGVNLQTQTHDALIQTHAQTIRTMRQQGASDAQIQDAINSENDQAHSAGVLGTQINDATSKALENAAVAANDPSLLNIADGIKAGTGVLTDTEQMAQARMFVTQHSVETDNAAHTTEVRHNNEVRATAMTAAINAITADPTGADIRPQIAALTATKDFTAIENLQAYKAATQHKTDKDDSAGWTSVMEDLTSDHPTLTRAHLSAMAANGDLTPEHVHTASDMMTEQEKAAQEKSKSNSYTKDPLYSLSMKVLRSNFMSSVGGVGILNPGFGKAAESLDSQLQELITSPAYLAMDATKRRAAAAGIVQTATDNANLTTLGSSGKPPLTIEAAKKAQQANADTSFAHTLQTEIASGSFSAATTAEIRKRGLLTAEQRLAFMRKMGLTPQTNP